MEVLISMALDGITISNIVFELKKNLLNGRIDKISQPERDEVIISVRSFRNNFKILLTANSSHPRLHFTDISKQNPMTAPLFCMVLRKHLNNGKILDITQPDFERIVIFHIESMNEMGDMSTKKLIIEIMGKHSNIILVDDKDMILDAIKHISHEKSSVREVLPAKNYIFPPSSKLDPTKLNKDEFLLAIAEKKSSNMQSIIYKSYNGISPIMASEICSRAGIDPSSHGEEISDADSLALYNEFEKVLAQIQAHQFSPEICYDEKGKAVDFFSLEFSQYNWHRKINFDSISKLLESFYRERDETYRILQKTQELRKLVTQNIERCIRKRELQSNILKEVENREHFLLLGTIITAHIYDIKKGETEISRVNFQDPECKEITIQLDPTLTPAENGQEYYKKYNKQKRTFDATELQISQNEDDLKYLETILNSLSLSGDEADIEEIRDELCEQGFIKKRRNNKNKKKKTKPLLFHSSDGYEIYVGKNNNQNDELTTKLAKNNDIWLHTKDIPGSHVIIKSQGKEEIPDSTITEAAHLAAYYSKARSSSSVPVDYTFKKYVKKPNYSKPGMVIYVKQKTTYITPDELLVQSLAVK